MFQKPLQVFELLQRFDQFFQVFQPTGGLGRFVILPHGGIAAFIQDNLGQFHMRYIGVACHATPSINPVDQGTQFTRCLAA